MSGDILDKGSSMRRIITLLTLLLLLISALIFLFNRGSLFANKDSSKTPVVVSPNGDVKTFPSEEGKNGNMPTAKVYDMLEKTPPPAKKPSSVKDIIASDEKKAAAPTPQTGAEKSTSKVADKPADKPSDKKPEKQTEKKSSNEASNQSAQKKINSTAQKPSSVADLVAKSESKPTSSVDKKTSTADKKTATVDKKPATADKKTTTVDKKTATNVAPPAKTTGNYNLQMASFTDEATAQKFLESLKPKTKKIFSTKPIGYRVATGTLANGQKVFRPQLTGFTDKEDATAACQKIKSQLPKADCLVLKNS